MDPKYWNDLTFTYLELLKATTSGTPNPVQDVKKLSTLGDFVTPSILKTEAEADYLNILKEVEKLTGKKVENVGEDEVIYEGYGTYKTERRRRKGKLISEDQLVKYLHERNRSQTHISFTLAMMTYEGIRVHDYDRRPCYGELRKYQSTDDDYTNPYPEDNYHPTDLPFLFPHGTPYKLAFTFIGNASNKDQAIRALFSRDCPWAPRGFNPDAIEFTVDKDNVACGIILHDMNFDPTVLIQHINLMREWEQTALYLKAGATPFEAIVIPRFTHFSVPSIFMLNNNNNYYTTDIVDLEKIFNHQPDDLTGGVFANRYDYNRVRLHEIFEGDFPIFNEIGKRLGNYQSKDWIEDYYEFSGGYQKIIEVFRSIVAEKGLSHE